jgi:hypothetical protein
VSAARQRIVAALEALGRGVTASGAAHCPAHDDRQRSLSVRDADQFAGVLVHCHAGCDINDVVGALDLSTADLFDEPLAARPAPSEARYDYTDESGALLYTKVRAPEKRFWIEDASGRKNRGGVRPMLYRLPEVLLGVRCDETIYIVEGEKDADAVYSIGEIATCNFDGAGTGKWRPDYGDVLRGAELVIVQDKDDSGRRHAREIYTDVVTKARTVRVVEALIGNDVSDHLAAQRALDELVPVSMGDGGPVSDVAGVAGVAAAVDGASVLDAVEAFFSRFVIFPSEAARVAVVLWTAHAHLTELFESTPRLALLSREPGSGKTRVLEVMELLVPRPVHAVNASPAYLFRKVSDEEGLPVILFDEIDAIFGPKAKGNEELRAMLNAGHRRGAVSGRCIPGSRPVETEDLPAFCAVAVAGLGNLPATILTRSVIVRMRRRAPGERVEPFRYKLNAADGHTLRDQLADWTAAISKQITSVFPEMPVGVEDRAADVWEPLLAIADAAGGAWPDRARMAAVTLVTQASERPLSLGLRLLADIRSCFDAAGVEKIHGNVLLRRLHDLDEAPWADLRGKPLDQRGLARMLSEYGIQPKDVRSSGRIARGYKREDMHDAWTRYLPTLE